jgi:ferredoxin/flavodoxin---NADP+ reductase
VLPPLDSEWDRVMICGNPQLITDMPALLEDRGFAEGNTGEPGDYVIEKAFVEK